MVVHPAPGNPSGTLVNAVLHHCNLQPISLEADDANDNASGAEAPPEKLCTAVTTHQISRIMAKHHSAPLYKAVPLTSNCISSNCRNAHTESEAVRL